MTAPETLGRILEIPPGGVWSLAAVGAFLTLSLAYRGAAFLARRDAERRRRLRSVGTWWAFFLLLLAVLAVGRSGVVFVMLGISLLALREALRLAARSDLYPWAAAATVALYLWAWRDGSTPFLWVLPPLGVLLVGAELVARVDADRLPGRPGVRLALLSTVVGPSYAVAVASLPAAAGATDGRLGWIVLLALLTAVHDSAQAWWGRTFGSRSLAPELSPAKTREGLWGGLATTATVAALAGPALVPGGGSAPPLPGGVVPPRIAWAGFGVLLGLAGTGGDLAASALKRRAGVEDSGDLVPGHGGVLDRFDSLAATAPLFFFLAVLLRIR